MNLKKKRTIILITLTLFLLTGCDTPSFDDITGSNYSSSSNDAQTSYTESKNSYQPYQEISYNSSMTAETKTYNKDHDTVINLVKKNNALILSQDSFQNEEPVLKEKFIQTNYQIQVPKDHYQALTAALKDHFYLSRFVENSEDVGQSKMTTKEKLQLVEDEIKIIEDTLNDTNVSAEEKTQLRVELRSLKQEKSTLSYSLKETNDSVEYSTINFELREVPHFSNEKPSLWYNLRLAFSGFFGKAISVLAYSFLSLVFFIPFIIILAFTRLITRKMWYKWLQKGINSGKFDIEAIKNSKKLD